MGCTYLLATVFIFFIFRNITITSLIHNPSNAVIYIFYNMHELRLSGSEISDMSNSVLGVDQKHLPSLGCLKWST